MADTLQSLAGSAFYSTDVLEHFHVPVAPETAVLDRYVFLPHARSGIAAALTTPFAWGGPARGTVEMAVPVIDDRGPLNAAMTVNVYGPGDVTELATRQVVRTWPKADAHDSEVDDLVQVEFDRPELPWLFTPAAPVGGRLVPWLTLVVAEADTVVWTGRRGEVALASIRRDQLQPLGDAWAWAHAQVMGAKPADPAAAPTLEQRLSGANAAFNVSRLLCPRRLEPGTAYVACVVPTFSAGSQTGRGLTADTTLQPAWGTAVDFGAGDPFANVDLPVYYSWRFSTGESGNFESLARKIKPAVAPPGVGRRRVDATQPWPGTALAADDPGAEIVVQGPIVSPQDPEDYPEQHWPDEAAQRWAAPIADQLVETLNRADQQAHEPDPGPPLVGPPLYGGHHAKQPRIETAPAAAAAQPEWFRQLNLDPRDRVVGGLGTRVVQMDQEALMVSAWNQVVGVEDANRQLRLAQLAKHVSAALHRRHLARFSDAAVLQTTERVQTKILHTAQTVWADLDASATPAVVTTGAFRRLLRVRGPVVRRADAALDAVQLLAVQADGLSTDWVQTYLAPDAVDRLGAASLQRLAEVAGTLAPGVDPKEWAARLADQLVADGPERFLDPDVVAGIDPAELASVESLAGTAVVGLLQQIPSPQEVQQRDDRTAARTAVIVTLQLKRLLRAGLASHVAEYRVRVPLVRRLDLPVRRDDRDPELMVATAADLDRWAEQYQRMALQFSADLPLDELDADAAAQADRLSVLLRRAREETPEGLKRAAEKVIRTDGFAEPDRARLDVPALEILRRLDPATTVPARIRARLGAGTGRYPSWLRPDWFDDLRIEPVMAHPVFHHAMYEALDRYDRNWLIPGLGLIKKPDMATLLQTNNRFVEAFLVGLNHEMGRELLWREYPTDQRGTYFSTFWTGAPELVADLHEAAWRHGGLGTHVDAALDGQLVFLIRGDLVRRYPGVVAHAVRQARVGGVLQHDRGVPILEAGTAESPKKTLFQLHLAPNLLLVGFALKEAEVRSDVATWWFTLSENPTEPRFGLDESRPAGPNPKRDDLAWSDFGTAPGGFLSAGVGPGGGFPNAETGDDSRWPRSSAEMAYILFQLPARAAFKGERMLDAND